MTVSALPLQSSSRSPASTTSAERPLLPEAPRRRDFLVAEPKMVLYDWLNERIGIPWSTDFRAFGRVVDGKLVGVVGYNGYNGASCQMHMAGDGPRWVTRELIKVAFHVPFVQWGLKVVFALVPDGNKEALKIDLKLGFKEVAKIDDAHPDGVLHLLEMRREHCRWV